MNLSPRQTQVLSLLVDGYRPAQVQAKLNITESTFAYYLKEARGKLKALTNYQAVAKFAKGRLEHGSQ